MDFTLTPTTEAGLECVRRCEAHIPEFAGRAEMFDRENRFAFENFEDLRESGLMAATVAPEFGGLGVESLNDLTVAISRIARGDASTAIALNMHLVVGWFLSRMWKRACAGLGEIPVDVLEMGLGWIGSGELVVVGAGTEPGTHTLFPLTEATPVDGGWVLNGHKTFVTLSPIATAFNTFCRYADDEGQYRVASAWVLRETPGVTIKESWDALGMRASGSHEMILTDCFVSEDLFFDGGAWGDATVSWLVNAAGSNLPLLGAFLGIAESVRDRALPSLQSSRKAPSNRTLAERFGVQQIVGQIEIDLAACRAILERDCRLWDTYLATHSEEEMTLPEVYALCKDYQCTKAFVNRKAIDIVDAAMTAVGGRAYTNASPFSRAYRDVRAGPFMQPYSPVEAFEFIGKIALEQDPQLDM